MEAAVYAPFLMISNPSHNFIVKAHKAKFDDGDDEMIREKKAKPVPIQKALAQAIETVVSWWKDPAKLLALIPVAPQQLINAEVQRVQHQVLRQDRPPRRLSLDMEPITVPPLVTPASPKPDEVSHVVVSKLTVTPIRSEVEAERGLAVLLTDPFVPIAYIQ